jgi:uncharacterized membrane protein YeaQ/YmgE (transglycosylase-associated protein family)
MDKLDTILQWTGMMALLVGAIGFVIGYYGPVIFTPDSNQGPLIGIFVTGPGGAIVGAIIGAFIGYKKSKGTRSR